MILGGVSVVGQVPAGYYDGASGLSGAPLKSALSHIIRIRPSNPTLTQ